MRSLNDTTDVEYYTKSGNLTKPFLDDEYVLEKVMCDFQSKLKERGRANELESLFSWINHNVKFCHDEEFVKANKFQRTAKEVWESKKSTGCTDYAILFATFARQIGIPTTFLTTVSDTTVQAICDKNIQFHKGHAFCECHHNGKWVLVDPTFMKIEEDYNPERLQLSYKVSETNIYIPYFRDRDLHDRQTIRQFNHNMDKSVEKLFQEKRK